MDKKLDILLGSVQNIDSVNVDNYDRLMLENKRNNILEYDIRNILNVTEVFESERQGTEVYRIYGGIDYLSLLHGIRDQYSQIEDYFTPYYCPEGETCTFRNLYDSFDFYLVRPHTGYTQIEDHPTEYVRQFEVIATPDDFDVFNAGYSKNIFNDEKSEFIITKDIDITGMVDEFGFPMTEIYIYAAYNVSTNGTPNTEYLKRRVWDSVSGITDIEDFNATPLSIGDLIQGDKINYYKSSYLQTPYSTDGNAEYYIYTYYESRSSYRTLRWKYNPFIPIRLQYLSEELKRANINGTSYEQATNIPYYATELDGENYVWREILEQGYIDPLTDRGVEYPFVNKRRYVFENIILSVVPDLSYVTTAREFGNIEFGDPIVLAHNPINDDIGNIGKPCQ